MAAYLREMQENQELSEIQIDKLRFVCPLPLAPQQAVDFLCVADLRITDAASYLQKTQYYRLIRAASVNVRTV